MAVGGGNFSLGDAVLSLVGDATSLNKALNDAEGQAKRSFGNIAGHMQNIGAGMAIAGGVILGGLGLAVKAASESDAALAQLDAVLKSTGGAAGMTREELIKLSAELQKQSKFDDEAILGAESLTLTFTNIGKEVFPAATQAILDMSQAMGQDLQTTTIQVGKALNDPIKGVTALRRVGVQLSEQQHKQVKDFMAVGNAAAAQKVILGELAKEFGGSALAASKTMSGQLVMMKNQFGDLLEQIGGALIPSLQQLVVDIRPAIESVAAWITANPVLTATIVKWAAAIGGVLVVGGPLLIFISQAMMALAAFNTLMGSTIAINLVGWIGGLIGAPGVGFLGLAGSIAAVVGVGAIGWMIGRWIDSVTSDTRFGKWIDAQMDKLVALIAKLKEWLGMKEKTGDDYLGMSPEAIAARNKIPESLRPKTYAGGTPHHPGGMAIVGERGPELVNLPRGSKVFSNSESKMLMGGGGGTQNITVEINAGNTDPKDWGEADFIRIKRGLTRVMRMRTA